MVPIITGRSGVLVTNPVLRKLSPFGSRLGNTDKSIVFQRKRGGKKVKASAGETGRVRSWSRCPVRAASFAFTASVPGRLALGPETLRLV